MEILAAVLLVLAFPVIAIVALVKAHNMREDLRQLQLRVAVLEAGRPRQTPLPNPGQGSSLGRPSEKQWRKS